MGGPDWESLAHITEHMLLLNTCCGSVEARRKHVLPSVQCCSISSMGGEELQDI